MRRDVPAANPKGERQCPANWMQSGDYWLEMRKR
jgi:hypothetical protein